MEMVCDFHLPESRCPRQKHHYSCSVCLSHSLYHSTPSLVPSLASLAFPSLFFLLFHFFFSPYLLFLPFQSFSPRTFPEVFQVPSTGLDAESNFRIIRGGPEQAPSPGPCWGWRFQGKLVMLGCRDFLHLMVKYWDGYCYSIFKYSV